MSLKNPAISILFLLVVTVSCQQPELPGIAFRHHSPDTSIYDLAYGIGNWDHPNYSGPFESRGNHRIVIEVAGPHEGPVQAVLPWRRPDLHPGQKAVIVTYAETGEQVEWCTVLEVTPARGHVVFDPTSGPGRYHVYYLPHRSTGGYYPRLEYIAQEDVRTTSGAPLFSEDELEGLSHAHILEIQSIDDFHSFFPMEVIATEAEEEQFTRSFPAAFHLFPEYRDRPIRMDRHLPLHWVSVDRPANGLRDTVRKGEFYAFQVGVWSPMNDLTDLDVKMTALKARAGTIAEGSATCFNTGGIDLEGKPFVKQVDVRKGRVLPLWCGYTIPADAPPGDYLGEVIIRPGGMGPDTVFLSLHLLDQEIEEPDDNPQLMSRLRWINSTVGLDSGFIARPFTPLEVDGHTLRLLGREIELGPLGFPTGIYSYFSQEMTRLTEEGLPLLSAGMGPEVVLPGGLPVRFDLAEFRIDRQSPGAVAWRAAGSSNSLDLIVQGELEYDGMLEYRIALVAREALEIDDFIFRMAMPRDAAEYMLGLGFRGGKRPAAVDWTWDTATRHQEGAWLGTVNRGLQFVLRDEHYERPLNTNFYRQKPLRAPVSWYNNGKGGIRIRESGSEVAVECYSGSRRVQQGDTLHFNIRFLITPFKLIDTEAHFRTRFVHRYVPVDSVVAWNGTIINVHHANEINPYINYPFYNAGLQKAYIDEAHAKGVKVKLYNTIRELTYRAYELFPLRSLGFEVFNDGEGGGHSWLQEHLRDHYHAAWHATSVNDAAILNKGTARWTNYYIEGVRWLAENQHIDGLYLDDIAFSRTTVKRLANVLQTHRDEVVIDLHSANQFNERDGYINSAFLYMEHMPYITRLWFGEYFEYDRGPDYWLTEVSGIPFGLTGEMLEGGGHPWRGLVYGMTARIYGDTDPRPLWKLFDDYDIAHSEMLGYWVERSPVKTDVEGIRSTAYLHEGHVVVAIGSWSDRDEQVPLLIDWEKLGWGKEGCRMYKPRIEGQQEQEELDPGKPVPVERQQGCVVVLESKNAKSARRASQ